MAFLLIPCFCQIARSESLPPRSDRATSGNEALPASPKSAAAAPAKVRRYVERIIRAYDTNGDGQLQRAEWQAMQGQPGQIDGNGDGIVTDEEFVRHVMQFAARRHIRLLSPEPQPATVEAPLLEPVSREPAANTEEKKEAQEEPSGPGSGAAPDGVPADAGSTSAGKAEATSRDASRPRDRKFYVPPSRMPKDLPAWFHSRDRDGDGQITLSEYAPAMTSALLAEFSQFDLDSDGVITVQEYLARAKGAAKAPPPTAPAPPGP